MKGGKRAQFYLIAAVIISSVIIALVTLRNYAVVEKEPQNFYDVSSQIKDEAAKVIDYGVLSSSDKMDDFARNISENLRKTDPNIESIMIFGNKDSVTVLNFGNTTAQVGETLIPGAVEDVESYIILNVSEQGFQKKQEGMGNKLFTNSWAQTVPITGQENVIIHLNGQDYVFKLYEYQQFFMIIKKGSKGGEYVEVK
jgi:hypothetical protein